MSKEVYETPLIETQEYEHREDILTLSVGGGLGNGDNEGDMP